MYFHHSRQDCAYTYTHMYMHTNLQQKFTLPTQYCPPPPVTTTQAAVRDINRQDLPSTLLYPSPLHCFKLLLLLSPAFLSPPLPTLCLKCHIQVTSSLNSFRTDRRGSDSGCWLLLCCQVARVST